MNPIESPYLTIDQAAAYCHCAKQTIYNHRRDIDRLPGLRTLRFTKEALDRWLATRPKKKRR
jgi:predicted DNA-binding transcriptional regulator AlpA